MHRMFAETETVVAANSYLRESRLAQSVEIVVRV